MREPLVGLFVGGKSSRMGSAKGLLRHPVSGVTLLEHVLLQVRKALPESSVVLVGKRPEYSELASELQLVELEDAVSDQGPLSGLVSLLRQARMMGVTEALAVACDMPFLTPSLLLKMTKEAVEAPVLCSQSEGKYEALFARYSVSLLEQCEEQLDKGRLSLQELIREAGGRELLLSKEERALLVDWDHPEQVLVPEKKK